MVAVPAATPFTTPVVPMVATPVLLLLHTPPAVVLLKVVVDPWHTDATPVIAAGNGFTVTVTVVLPPATV